MGLLYEYFAAESDQAAAAILTTAWATPTFRDEGIPPEELDRLEAVLTGRSDSGNGAEIAELVDEDAGVAECGVLGMTDTLTRALATADAAALAAAAAAWQDEATVRGLAAVARHAAQHGHRLYCFWTL